MNTPETNTYIFKELKGLEDKYLQKAAVCLAEAFVGVQVKDYVVSEPIVIATKLTMKDFTEVTRLYLESTVHQGFHFIAIDEETDEVVGVIGTDNFDPAEEAFIYEGNLEVMNFISDFLVKLDLLFIEKFEHVIGRELKQGDLLHGFFIGVKAPKNKHLVAKQLVNLVLEKGAKEGFTGFFVEATNPRSQNLVKKAFDAYMPTSIEGKPLFCDYKDSDFLNVIPPEIATCTEILYIPIDKSVDLK